MLEWSRVGTLTQLFAHHVLMPAVVTTIPPLSGLTKVLWQAVSPCCWGLIIHLLFTFPCNILAAATAYTSSRISSRPYSSSTLPRGLLPFFDTRSKNEGSAAHHTSFVSSCDNRPGSRTILQAVDEIRNDRVILWCPQRQTL